jgi:hypothetical protein
VEEAAWSDTIMLSSRSLAGAPPLFLLIIPGPPFLSTQAHGTPRWVTRPWVSVGLASMNTFAWIYIPEAATGCCSSALISEDDEASAGGRLGSETPLPPIAVGISGRTRTKGSDSPAYGVSSTGTSLHVLPPSEAQPTTFPLSI